MKGRRPPKPNRRRSFSLVRPPRRLGFVLRHPRTLCPLLEHGFEAPCSSGDVGRGRRDVRHVEGIFAKSGDESPRTSHLAQAISCSSGVAAAAEREAPFKCASRSHVEAAVAALAAVGTVDGPEVQVLEDSLQKARRAAQERPINALLSVQGSNRHSDTGPIVATNGEQIARGEGCSCRRTAWPRGAAPGQAARVPVAYSRGCTAHADVDSSRFKQLDFGSRLRFAGGDECGGHQASVGIDVSSESRRRETCRIDRRHGHVKQS